MNAKTLEESVTEISRTLPAGVMLVAAAKTRTTAEVKAAVQAGIEIIGYNYVQEAEWMQHIIGNQVQWHMIGHLQRNKARRAVKLFDMIETIDSWRFAGRS